MMIVIPPTRTLYLLRDLYVFSQLHWWVALILMVNWQPIPLIIVNSDTPFPWSIQVAEGQDGKEDQYAVRSRLSYSFKDNFDFMSWAADRSWGSLRFQSVDNKICGCSDSVCTPQLNYMCVTAADRCAISNRSLLIAILKRLNNALLLDGLRRVKALDDWNDSFCGLWSSRSCLSYSKYWNASLNDCWKKYQYMLEAKWSFQLFSRTLASVWATYVGSIPVFSTFGTKY